MLTNSFLSLPPGFKKGDKLKRYLYGLLPHALVRQMRRKWLIDHGYKSFAHGLDFLLYEDMLSVPSEDFLFQNRLWMTSAADIVENMGRIDSGRVESVKRLLTLFRPCNVRNYGKVRVGGLHDGGYVMLDDMPDEGIVYSFGVSQYSPWDLDMANRGFVVHQYDGTIDAPPDSHPRLIFNQCNITGASNPPPGFKNISQILKDNEHEAASDLILQIDIEGYEWDFFSSITDDQMKQFRQVIVEFHGLHPDDSRDQFGLSFPDKLKILEKINRTHSVLHHHFNNYARLYAHPDLPPYYHTSEVSYVLKSADYDFSWDDSVYPVNGLDSPCAAHRWSPPFGRFGDWIS